MSNDSETWGLNSAYELSTSCSLLQDCYYFSETARFFSSWMQRGRPGPPKTPRWELGLKICPATSLVYLESHFNSLLQCLGCDSEVYANSNGGVCSFDAVASQTNQESVLVLLVSNQGFPSAICATRTNNSSSFLPCSSRATQSNSIWMCKSSNVQ